MFKRFFFLLLFIALSLPLYSQQWIEVTEDFYPFSQQIQQDKNSQGSVTGYTTSVYAMGRKLNPDQTSFISRSYHQFDISHIPDNSEIEEVRVYYTTGNGSSYSFKITKVTTISTTDLGANWSAIGNGSTMDQGITYGNDDFLSSNIKTQIGNLLNADEIILGCLSQNESANDSFTSLLIHLQVKYKYPATNYPYNATNLLKGAPGEGSIGVGLDSPPVQHDSPYNNFSAYKDQEINLKAYDNQTINNLHWLFNDGEAPLNRSKWEQDHFGEYSDIGTSSSVSVTAGEDNAGSTFRDYLKQNCQIDKKYQTEFDGNLLISTNWKVEGNTLQISAPSSYTPTGGSINYSYAGWADDITASNTRNLLPTDDNTYTSLYKYGQHSENQNAYSRNHQQQFIRTTNGHLHMVYESMGHVWYERSIDGGQTWQIMNNGKRLDRGGGGAMYPSIDYCGNYYYPDQVVIVFYEERTLPPYYGANIIAQFYDNGVFQYETPVAMSEDLLWEIPEPVISFRDPTLLVAWNTLGINYRLGQLNSSESRFAWNTPIRQIQYRQTTYVGDHPTIGASKTSNSLGSYHLAWDGNNTNILGIRLSVYQTYTNPPYDVYETEGYIFNQAGFPENYEPSISVMPNEDFRLSWIGGNSGTKTRRVVTWFNNQFYIFGTYVTSHSTSATSDGRDIIAYGDYNGGLNKFAHIWYYTYYHNLYTTGSQTHLANGSSLGDMYAMSFQNTTSPYSFSMSQNLGSLAKANTANISSGREALITGDTAQFYFILGDVTVDNGVANFIETSLNPDFSSIDTLNYYLKTEPFTLRNTSQFGFSIQYGVTDSLKAISEFNENEYVKFKLQLINANNGNLLGEYNVATFNQANIIPYFGETFTVNTNGIGNKTVFLKILAEENINGNYDIANINADENILPKKNGKEIAYSGMQTINEYVLEQNYPNPFNPATTINYQLPEEGFVILKVYDILGKEVATLVNKQKNRGRYVVNFDATDLASGVYIYQLRVNDYMSSHKMLLLK